MESLEEAVAALPARWPKSRRYLAAVSGGLDSTVLLRLLAESGYRRVTVCHLDHRLRGRQSTGDAAFVKRLAEKLAYDFVGIRVDIAKAAKESGSLWRPPGGRRGAGSSWRPRALSAVPGSCWPTTRTTRRRRSS